MSIICKYGVYIQDGFMGEALTITKISKGSAFLKMLRAKMMKPFALLYFTVLAEKEKNHIKSPMITLNSKKIFCGFEISATQNASFLNADPQEHIYLCLNRLISKFGG
jgi:hypothetical protein